MAGRVDDVVAAADVVVSLKKIECRVYVAVVAGSLEKPEC